VNGPYIAFVRQLRGGDAYRAYWVAPDEAADFYRRVIIPTLRGDEPLGLAEDLGYKPRLDMGGSRLAGAYAGVVAEVWYGDWSVRLYREPRGLAGSVALGGEAARPSFWQAVAAAAAIRMLS
jgi:hypothetical protein